MKNSHRDLTNFGREVKKRLIDKDMTQVELANILGVNKQYVYKILYGERSGKKYIKKIAEILDIHFVA